MNKSVRLNRQDIALGILLAQGIPQGSNMTDCPTEETLAEFVDGKLPHESRARVAAHLGDCAKCYSILSESLTIREELSSQFRARMKRYFSYSIPAALAAAAVLLIVFRIVAPPHEFAGQQGRESAYRDATTEKKILPKPDITPSVRSFAGELADKLEGNNAAALLARRAGKAFKVGSTYGFSSVVSLEKSAFEIGVCLTDLEVAMRAKNKEKVEVFAQKLIELLRPMESSYGLIPSIIERKGTNGNAGKETGRYEGFSRVVDALFENKKEAIFYKFGAWVEAAGLAAEVRDKAFFEPAVVTGFKKELEKSGVAVGVLDNLLQLEAMISSGVDRADQFKTMARLLADIREMY